MDPTAAVRSTQVAGVATLAVGTALLLAPGPVGALADVTCAVGLLAGRPRWPWATTRTVLNLVQAGLVVGRGPRGALAAAGLTGLTFVDGAAARELYAARR
ncbi:hypothetical protein [Nocardioides sp. GXQ0305]|uniref:hypothetical protein n=1 Tax=Nocardioides sp. GXQ0305 TaxID=3423912 RepID=UPI003D7EFF4B